MAIRNNIDVSELLTRFYYDYADGYLKYKFNFYNKKKDEPVISDFHYNSKWIVLHRAILAIHTGIWPINTVIHIDYNKLNNNISNLYELQFYTNVEDLFFYDFNDDKLKYKTHTRDNRIGDDVVIHINNNGYSMVCVTKTLKLLSHVIWNLVNGPIPQNMYIDHKDRDITNNKISNLRILDAIGNAQNVSDPRSNNKVGLLGVSKHESGCYISKIRINGKNIHLGCFKTPELASDAYIIAKEKHHLSYFKIQEEI